MRASTRTQLIALDRLRRLRAVAPLGLVALVVLALLAGAARAAGGEASAPKLDPQQRDPQRDRQRAVGRVDLVIALDTSGSMQGLIDSARQKLWDIVNEVARVKPTPTLRVALVTFGSQGTEEDGYVMVRNDLTTNLDAIYARLFELTTSGGTEYVGRAVHRALKELSWDGGPGTLKQIFVAGNESADQDGSVRASRAALEARRRGVFVNTLYCGSSGSSDAPSWRQVARLGAGLFASIDHNRGTVNVATPYDQQLAELSARLTRTYVGYGAQGAAREEQQRAQDANAGSVHPSAGAARASAKASAVYRNEDWDLVDARKTGRLNQIGKDALPAPLQALNAKQLQAHLDRLEGDRNTLQRQIQALSKKREAHVASELAKQGGQADDSFDTALRRGIRQQAMKRGFKLSD